MILERHIEVILGAYAVAHGIFGFSVVKLKIAPIMYAGVLMTQAPVSNW